MWKCRQWLLNNDRWWQFDLCAGRVLVTKVSGEKVVPCCARRRLSLLLVNGGNRRRKMGKVGKGLKWSEWKWRLVSKSQKEPWQKANKVPDSSGRSGQAGAGAWCKVRCWGQMQHVNCMSAYLIWIFFLLSPCGFNDVFLLVWKVKRVTGFRHGESFYFEWGVYGD